MPPAGSTRTAASSRSGHSAARTREIDLPAKDTNGCGMRPYWRSESPRVPPLRNAREENFEAIVIDHSRKASSRSRQLPLGNVKADEGPQPRRVNFCSIGRADLPLEDGNQSAKRRKTMPQEKHPTVLIPTQDIIIGNS